MAMSTGTSERGVVSEINTTPLVDVMLVLLIIFLITIPVAIHSIPVNLPKEANQPQQSKPEHITLSVSRDGDIYWNELRLPSQEVLLERLKAESVKPVQPEIAIRGDAKAHYEPVGRVLLACMQAGIRKIAFVTEPPARGG